MQYIRQPISIGNLLLDVGNYRIVRQDSQKAARDAIIEEEGRKLVTLARDIIDNGLSPIDLQMVVDAEDGNGNYIVIEGNRRLVAIQLMLKPELAEYTPLHSAFKRLNKAHADAIPRVLDCVIVPSKPAGMVWIDRKHKSGLQGAGTEPWSAIAKARADADRGESRPELDAVNFVLANPSLPEALRRKLEGSEFNISTLKRLVDTKELQQAAGLSLEEGKLLSNQDKDRVQAILTDVVDVIASGRHKGEKWIERNIDTPDKREDFVETIVAKHPRRKRASGRWIVSGKPVKAPPKPAKAKRKATPSTDDQPNLIPKGFKLELPTGKINDIFVELKTLDIARYRHAVSVLLRIFIDFSLDDYIEKHGIRLPTDKKGKPVTTLHTRLDHVTRHVRTSQLMSDRELKPLHVAITTRDSLLAPDTLHAYIHSLWLNPDPLQLKLSWRNIQLFIERLWTSKSSSGQP
jgi:hypothetical protein